MIKLKQFFIISLMLVSNSLLVASSSRSNPIVAVVFDGSREIAVRRDGTREVLQNNAHMRYNTQPQVARRSNRAVQGEDAQYWAEVRRLIYTLRSSIPIQNQTNQPGPRVDASAVVSLHNKKNKKRSKHPRTEPHRLS